MMIMISFVLMVVVYTWVVQWELDSLKRDEILPKLRERKLLPKLKEERKTFAKLAIEAYERAFPGPGQNGTPEAVKEALRPSKMPPMPHNPSKWPALAPDFWYETRELLGNPEHWAPLALIRIQEWMKRNG